MQYDCVHNGDCVEAMREMPDCCVDAIVTDPPYELGFMGKAWDATGIAYRVELWQEALRVLKPGGHLLAFGGSRTYHRMASAIEDAGFEIRDQMQWIYGSGFPKSLDVSKAIDKMHGAEREITGRYISGGGGLKSGGGSARLGVLAGYTAPADTGERKDNPATPDAIRWQGWGTALKPSMEPVSVAQKPYDLCGLSCIAAKLEGFRYIGIELDAEYAEIARKRIDHYQPEQGLFTEAQDAS